MKYIFSLLLLSVVLLTSCGTKTSENPSLETQEGENREENQVENVSVDFEGVGTEPFWAFRFVDNSLLWQEPGEDDVQKYTASGTLSLDEQTQEIRISAGDFLATLIPDTTCTDGMSENTYTYKVLLQKDERSFSGCAREYVEQL